MVNSSNSSRKWLSISVVGIIVATCFSLSFWQYKRYLYKKDWLEITNKNKKLKPLTALPALLTKDFEARKFEVSGKIDLKRYFLRDNKYFKRQVGYLVYAPLKTTNSYYLVELGWISKGSKAPKVANLIKGEILCPKGKEFVLKHIPPDKGWPKILQSLDLAEVSREYKQIFSGCILSATGIAQKLPKREVMSPNRHIGYSVQWLLFGMIIVYIYYKLSRGK